MPELVFLRRGEEFLRVGVDRSRLVLGRAETSDVVIPDTSVARHQVAVLFDGGAVMVEDLSGKGTMVSGRKADQITVQHGADIALGEWRAEVRELASSTPAQRPSEENPQRWSSRGPMVGTVRVFGAESRQSAPGSSGCNATPESLLGHDPAMRQLADFVERVALSQSVVAIFGEPGSGRELVARTLHTRSGRANGPFVRVNCRAIRSELLAAELFGVEKGASHGASIPQHGAFHEAAGGTLFLDEVGALSLDLQAALLLALEARQFYPEGTASPSRLDARVVVATNEDLLSATRLGLFREDLYDLLCMAPLILPPLRHRRGDVPALAEHLVKTFSPRGQRVRITSEALDRLAQHPWPGNIRELRSVVHRALLLRAGPTIDVGELRLDARPSPREGGPLPGGFVPGLTLEQMLQLREREIIESALRHFDNNRERVARELGVARSTLFKRLKDWGLTKHDAGPPSA
jgi:two-component system, NtrC family, response regulator HydG